MTFPRLLLISRPLFWFLTAGSFLLGIGKFSNFNAITIIEFCLFLFPLNLFIYGINDIYDIKSDEINPRKGDLQGVVLHQEEALYLKKILFIAPLILLIVSLVSLHWQNVIFSVVFTFFAYAYSDIHFRFKEIPFIDSLSSTIIYMSPALVAYSLHDNVNLINPVNYLYVLPTVGIHSLTTLKDRIYDDKAGVMTVGVYLKEKKTILFSLFTCIIPFMWIAVKAGNPFLLMIFAVGVLWNLILLFTKLKYSSESIFAVSTVFLSLWVMTMFYFSLLQQSNGVK